MSNVTSLSVVDDAHFNELMITAPALQRFCPDIWNNPWVIVCDVTQHRLSWWQTLLCSLQHENLTVLPSTSPPSWDQRERMLSEFVLTAPWNIDTEWFVKIDSDAFPSQPTSLIEPEWIDRNPAFISSSWGYSKPANVIERLDNWGDTIPELAKFPRLDIPYDAESSRVCHRRIISFVYVGNTAWHRQVATMCGDRLPVPSQDTLCHYVAERTKQFYRTVKFKKRGWQHVSGRRLQQAVQGALA